MTRICCGQRMTKDTTSKGTVKVYVCETCGLVVLPTEDDERVVVADYPRSSERDQ